jgi:nicotinamidase-related amidase
LGRKARGAENPIRARYQGIRDLVITGVTTNACVERTSRDATDIVYGCVIIEDATVHYGQDRADAVLG